MKDLISCEVDGCFYRTEDGVLFDSYRGDHEGLYRPAGNCRMWLVEAINGAPYPCLEVSIQAHDGACRVFDNLRWQYDGDGEWSAHSAIHDDGLAFVWRIGVCEDGTFAVHQSDTELTKSQDTFDCLENAKLWCQWSEFEFVNDLRKSEA